jgi:hypothetical protein
VPNQLRKRLSNRKSWMKRISKMRKRMRHLLPRRNGVVDVGPRLPQNRSQSQRMRLKRHPSPNVGPGRLAR